MGLRGRGVDQVARLALCLAALSVLVSGLPAAAQTGEADLTILIRASHLSDALQEAIDA